MLKRATTCSSRLSFSKIPGPDFGDAADNCGRPAMAGGNGIKHRQLFPITVRSYPAAHAR